jgi:hypothetical protein
MEIVEPGPHLKLMVRLKPDTASQALALATASRRSLSVQSTEQAVCVQSAEQSFAAVAATGERTERTTADTLAIRLMRFGFMPTSLPVCYILADRGQ